MADSYKDLPKTMEKIAKDLKEIHQLNEENQENLRRLFGGK